MRGNLYKNQDFKFSLWAKRLVWNGLDANASIDVAITGAQNSNDVKTPEEILAVAEADLLTKKPKDYGEKEESKAAYDKALLAVRAAKEKYEKVAKDLATKVALAARLAAVDPAKDFLHSVDEMKDIKAKNDLLPKEMRILVNSVDSVINTEALTYYQGKQNVTWFADGGMKGDYEVSTSNFRYVMRDISEMQEAILTGFYGLAEDQKESMTTDYKQRIDVGLQWLQAHRDEKITGEGGNYPVINPDEKPALDRMAFAFTNLAAAEKGGQEGHEAGAKQYMAMVLAEQEARRAWIGFTYGSTNILTRSKEGHPSLQMHYNAGVNAFNEALLLSGRTKAPKYSEAAAKFKEAARSFRLVKETELKIQADPETNPLLVPAFNKAIDSLATTIGKIKNAKLFDKLIKDNYDQFLAAVKDAKTLKEQTELATKAQQVIDAEVSAYNEAVEKVRSSIIGAVEQNQRDEYYFNSDKGKVIRDYLMDPSLKASVPDKYQAMIFDKDLRVFGNMKIGEDWYSYSYNYGGEEPIVSKDDGAHEYARNTTPNVEVGIMVLNSVALTQAISSLKRITGGDVLASDSKTVSPS